MMERTCFGILGGDRRQLYLAEGLVRDGHAVYTFGLEQAQAHAGGTPVSFEQLCSRCPVILLPLPVTLDGIRLHAPYAKEPLPLSDFLAMRMKGKRVLGGMIHRLKATSPLWEDVDCRDYSTQEEFAIQNAVPTAEGALEIAMRESVGTLYGSRCLVTGYGRIGKVLSDRLAGMGASVAVAARKSSDRVWAELHGYQGLDFSQLGEHLEVDFLFNTVPSVIFDEALLSRIPKDCLCMELASAPGGFDLEAAERLDRTILKAASLPGKVAPKAAGEIMKHTIYHILEE